MERTTELSNQKSDDILTACLRMEVLCADIYRELARIYPGNQFPNENFLFNTLADSEDRHAFIVQLGMRFNKINKMHDMIVLDIVSQINDAIDRAKTVQSHIRTEKVSLKEMLKILIEIEESIAEIYLQDLMRNKTDSTILSYLQKFYTDEKHHAEMIKDLMKEKGYHFH